MHHVALSVLERNAVLASGFFRENGSGEVEEPIKASSILHNEPRDPFFESSRPSRILHGRQQSALAFRAQSRLWCGTMWPVAVARRDRRPANAWLKWGDSEKFTSMNSPAPLAASKGSPRSCHRPKGRTTSGIEVSERPRSRRRRAARRDAFRTCLTQTRQAKAAGGQPTVDLSKRGRFS